MFTESFKEMSTFDKATTVTFCVAIILSAILLTVYLLTKKYRPDAIESFKKISFGIVLGYIFGMISLLLFFKLDNYFAKDYIDLTTFIPVICLMAAIVIVAIVGLILSIFKQEKLVLFGKISAAVLGAFLLAIIIAHTVLLYKDKQDINISKEIALYALSALLIAIDVIAVLLFGKKYPDENRTKTIVYAGILIAMSFALSYIKLFSLPQGGSVTLASFLPLMIFSYMFGIRKGFVVGVIYGILQFAQSPWFYHPAQFLLDYPIAFGSIGLAGLFKELHLFENKKALQFVLGAITVSILRYFAHVISGIFVFGSGDPENYTAVAWSFLYNAFTFADIAICIVAGGAMFMSKSFVTYLEKAKI